MSKLYTHLTIVVVLVLFSLVHSHAQINAPRGSQMATVSQTVGISTIEIQYSRPSVNGREIWGNLVPYGLNNLGFGTSTAAPWRAGANENTTITFSDDVKVEGQSVPAGTYALFFNVHQDNTAHVILNKKHTAWGSFFYEEKDDVVNAKINTATVPHTEMLTYGFPEVSPTEATLALMWGERSFPIKIEVPVTEIVLADIRNSMENQPGFNRQTWEQAAAFAANNGGDLQEALGWIDAAIAGQFFSQKTFANLQIKAGILNQMGRQDEALALMDDNMDLATILEVHQYGRQLIANGMTDKAMEVFEYNSKKNKDTWPVHYGMARAYSAKGDYKSALKHLEKSLVNAPNDASKGRVAANIDKLKKGEDIN